VNNLQVLATDFRDQRLPERRGAIYQLIKKERENDISLIYPKKKVKRPDFPDKYL
jgi:hypothetical protein